MRPESEKSHYPDPAVNFKDPLDVIAAAFNWMNIKIDEKIWTPKRGQKHIEIVSKVMVERKRILHEYLIGELSFEDCQSEIDKLPKLLDINELGRRTAERKRAEALEEKVIGIYSRVSSGLKKK